MSELRFETEFKGYDKEEVEAYLRQIEDDHAVTIRRAEEKLKEKDRLIEELRKRVDEEKEKLRATEEKYKGYAENYDKIAGLVYESQVKADAILREAHEKEAVILEEAEREARRRVSSVDDDVERSLADGRIRYRDIQSQIGDVVESLNAAQQRFMTAFREVHTILDSMPDTLDDSLESDVPFGDTQELPILDEQEALAILEKAEAETAPEENKDA